MKQVIKNAWVVSIALMVMTVPCLAADILQVSPQTITVAGTPLAGASTRTFYVGNGANATWTSQYTIAESSAWMSVSPSSGSTTGEWDAIVIAFVTTDLAAGVYEGDITVSQTNATVQAKTVSVTLTVAEDDNLGVAIGPSSAATTSSGIAIGGRTGRAVAIGTDTIQIGEGVNSSVGTTAIRTWQLLNSSGVIPAARRGAALSTTTNNIITAFDNVGSNNIVMTIRPVVVLDGQIVHWGDAQIVTNTF